MCKSKYSWVGTLLIYIMRGCRRLDKYIYTYADAYFNGIDSRTLHDDLYKELVLDLKSIIEEECNRIGLN